MKNTIIHYSIILFAYLAVLYPLWVRMQTTQWAFDSSLTLSLFPFFGILAFTLLWLHAISGSFEPFLRKHINFDWFVSVTSTIILVSIILHPLLLLASLNFSISNVFYYYGVKFVLLGIVGLALLLTYDILKPLRRREFIARHWRKALIVSNIGFVLTFFHSLYLGSSLQSGPLRIVWIFYGVTAIISLIYTYVIKNFELRNAPF